MMNTKTQVAISAAAIAVVAVLAGQFVGMALTPQEVYAPTGRRGYFCEFRPEAQLDIAYPIQAEIMAQTIAQQNGVGMLYLHQK